MTKFEVVHQITAGRKSPARAEAEAFASANIALCKYWGKRDSTLNLPLTSSLSVSLADLGTHIHLTPASSVDSLSINDTGIAPDTPIFRRLFEFADLFREPGARWSVTSKSSIPIGAGLASSASAFAALVRAIDRLMGWQLPGTALSILARMGSGSAARSIYDGFVEWTAGTRDDGMDSHAHPLPEHWPDFRIALITLVDTPKKVGSRDGMNRTTSESLLFRAWPEQVARDMAALRDGISRRDIETVGRAAEDNAMAMHATMLGCSPPLLYWTPASVQTLHDVWHLREFGTPVFATMDAGPNVKLIYTANASPIVREHFPTAHEIAPFLPLPL